MYSLFCNSMCILGALSVLFSMIVETQAYECHIGHYGYNCNETCGHCMDLSQCSNVSGICHTGCTSGYTGGLCKEECQIGLYGYKCFLTCGHCIDPAECNHVSGTCRTGCAAGYRGRLCIEHCDIGHYGYNCNVTCGQCYDPAQCSNVTGTCRTGCEAGYSGRLCKDDCDIGQYGYNCNETCGHCYDPTQCSTVTGTCRTGCGAGYSGRLCKDDIYTQLISPGLTDEIHVQTWRPNLRNTKKVWNIDYIDFGKGISYKASLDHSKWAVAKHQPFTCIGDINRQRTQFKRGGLSLCLENENVAESFRNLYSEIEKKKLPRKTCPESVRKKIHKNRRKK